MFRTIIPLNPYIFNTGTIFSDVFNKSYNTVIIIWVGIASCIF